jgi:hypothetical protein
MLQKPSLTLPENLPDIFRLSYPENLRRQLQAKLMDQRGDCPRPLQKVWLCSLCLKPIEPNKHRMHMHEALATRGDCQGELQWLIFHQCNSVLAHENCHNRILGHGGDEYFERCARELVKYEGYDRVHEFLEGICIPFPTIGKQVLRRFDSLEFMF